MRAETTTNGGVQPGADGRTAFVPSLAPDRLHGIRVPALPPSEIPIAYLELDKYPVPESYSWNFIQLTIAERLTQIAQQDMEVITPPPNVSADLAASTHALARSFPDQTPGQVATLILDSLKSDPIDQIADIEAHPSGFVNFELDMATFGREVLYDIEAMGDEYGNQNIGEGETVVMDVSSPNVAKYMSVGHLRSTVIGESLARIYRTCGFTVIRDNHLGDWGTQFGMLGRAKELWGEEIDREMPDAEPVDKLYTLYVRINDKVREEKAQDVERLRTEDPSLDERTLKRMASSALEQEGREWFSKLEKGDPDARALLREATAQSLIEFRRVYGLLGSNFEYFLGESFYEEMLPDVVRAFEESGTAKRDETGALSVDFPPDSHLPRLVLQKSDGTSLYQTREMATFIARTAWFNPERILYVVGGDQVDYFKQTFAAFGQLTEGEGPALEHVSFGMMTLPEGRMSSRKGNVVFLEDVLNAAIAKARTRLEESGRNLTTEEIDEFSRQIGVGAVIYADLRQTRKRNIKFDLNEAMSFEGNSAPYIQYAHARATSILKKAEEEGVSPEKDWDPEFSTPQEKDLIKELAKFPGAIAKALEENEPSVVAEQTFRIAEAFSAFYRNPILAEKDWNARNTRLRLTAATAQVLKNGLNLLGIEVPGKM